MEACSFVLLSGEMPPVKHVPWTRCGERPSLSPNYMATGCLGPILENGHFAKQTEEIMANRVQKMNKPRTSPTAFPCRIERHARTNSVGAAISSITSSKSSGHFTIITAAVCCSSASGQAEGQVTRSNPKGAKCALRILSKVGESGYEGENRATW